MRITILNNTEPFVYGGAEVLADALQHELEVRGHQTELVRLPFAWNPVERVYDTMLAASMTQIENSDGVIALKFPTYLVPHPNKVAWLMHQFRQFYDLWDAGVSGYEPTSEVLELRRMVKAADVDALLNCRARFINSETTQARLLNGCGLSSEVLYCPLPQPEMFREAAQGDYIFAGGRINAGKRQLLAVEAMKHCQTNVRLVVVGPPDNPADLARLHEEAAASPAADRIQIVGEFVSEELKADLVNNSLGAVYLPYDEDSAGYVALEAATASKPVVTTHDAGGVARFVIDEQTGYVTAASPDGLASAFDRLFANRMRARELGRGARVRLDSLGLSWDHVTDKLVAALS